MEADLPDLVVLDLVDVPVDDRHVVEQPVAKGDLGGSLWVVGGSGAAPTRGVGG
jgi:hypothetical protein